MKTTTITSLALAWALLTGCASSKPKTPCYTADQVIHILHQPHGITVGGGEPEAYMSPTLRRFMNEGTGRPARPLY